MKKTWIFKIPNPFYKINKYIKSFHECEFVKYVHDIPMNNDTHILISQCKCGKTKETRAHKNSPLYKKYLRITEK
jgi:hypothetical protein